MDTDTFTTLSALLPNPAATIVAIIDDQYLFVDCSLRPHFADWIVTPAHKLQRYYGQGPVLGVVVWVLVSPHHVLPVSLDAVALPPLLSDRDIP
jgi:hypothetical protein